MTTYYTLNEAAEKVRLSRDTLKRAIYDGSLKAKKRGRIVIRDSDLDAWFEGLPAA